MDIVKGMVVRTKAGHDKGTFMTVIEILPNENVLLCDGKLRKLTNPKLKNPKHLALTKTVLNSSELDSDVTIRKALKSFNGGT